MAEILCSVGLDVGTTSTQLVISQLTVENQSGPFSVPEMQISGREILYKSPVYFTPLLGEDRVDANALREIVAREYAWAGIDRESVDTGAIIITGETSRKENAEAVLRELSGFAGDFVVATAGPDLESVLAAKGAGAVTVSRETGKRVLHMDIGGGTSNLALIENGVIVSTGCLNVGGRLLKFDKEGAVTYVSPVLSGLTDLAVGAWPERAQVEAVAELLVQALEMASGLRSPGSLLEQLTTAGTAMKPITGKVVLSFSGGVADCIESELPWLVYGDLGPILGKAIRNSRLCAGEYMLGRETIRATVIGAGCHSAQLSGSTVYYRNVDFPLKNCPVIPVPPELENNAQLSEYLHQECKKREGTAVIALQGNDVSDYGAVRALAERLAQTADSGIVAVCLEGDMAKALGQALALRLPDHPILCIDRVRVQEESYLDVGAPVGPALPVVVKTIVLNQECRGVEKWSR